MTYVSKDGVLCLSKTQRKNLAIMFHHIKRDISYREGGTYSIGERFDEKQAKATLELIEHLESYIRACVL